MKQLIPALVFVLTFAAAAPVSSDGRVFSIDNAPDVWRGVIEKADAGIEALKKGLMGKLKKQMAEGGPASALNVCHDEAQAITAQMAKEQGIEMGRTSHKLRNPANAPREWVSPYVEKSAGMKARDFEPVVVDLGEDVGVIRPIDTKGLCLNCHGKPETFAPPVREKLGKLYPDDQATGFAVGDVRGIFWVEVPK